MRFASSWVISMEEFALAFPGPVECAAPKIASGLKRNRGSVAVCAPPVCADSVPARPILPAQSVGNQRRLVPESSRKGGLS
jgi:hypothetical protein